MEWIAQELGAFSEEKDDIQGANFTHETITDQNIFVREFGQNMLDATPKGQTSNLKVSIIDKTSGLDTKLLKEVVPKKQEDRLKAANPDCENLDWKDPKTLILEEFNTTGLTGNVSQPRAEGELERWNNFWYREGKPTKTKDALGRRGQGKITYYLASHARTLFGLSLRKGDDNDGYFIGKSSLRGTFRLANKIFEKSVFFTKGNKQPTPESDQKYVEKIKEGFQLTRNKELGTSWIIPFPAAHLTSDNLTEAFVQEFFVSVLDDRMVADVCGTEISQNTLEGLIKKYNLFPGIFYDFLLDGFAKPDAEFFVFRPGWEKGDKIDESLIEEVKLAEMKEKYLKGESVSVTLPIDVTTKDKNTTTTTLEVHLQKTHEDVATQELYVRGGLSISDESWLKKNFSRSHFGLVNAKDPVLSGLLACAEKATHLEWNASSYDLKTKYVNGRACVSAVRHSLPRLVKLLGGFGETKIKNALVDILSVPGKPGTKQRVRKKPNPGSDSTGEEETEKKRVNPELFIQSTNKTAWKLRPGKDVSKGEFPISANIVFAYARLPGTGDPFSKYLPIDFDLSSSKFTISSKRNISIIKRDRNQLSIEIKDPDFDFKIDGFSNTRITKARFIH